jgi:hypothetical protein
MTVIQRIEHWGDVHHAKWLDVIRIVLGILILPPMARKRSGHLNVKPCRNSIILPIVSWQQVEERLVISITWNGSITMELQFT